ncbi:MAG: nucleotidyl transferase AbiEii/AbiGii toxin family protein [Sulfurimonas sp.]|nr:nucleotidyl transferase AbiEii/AbiGii toxin family protein [Sulfurimonas sp.]MDQ7060123.1 nucleotidyl transferase AbiEii/AbiGii toxin family protein [Sulfurimonas sp.]
MSNTNPAILKMLQKYDLSSQDSAYEALREILQEIVLLGLSDAGFFDKAVFYGGTALRILYDLPRFSEDLDFSLIQKDEAFDLAVYESSVVEMLASFGFEVDVVVKNKDSSIQSAFLKGNTLKHMIEINAPKDIRDRFPKNKIVKIKFEVDTNPPLNFQKEKKLLLSPRPFMINSMTMSSLFAGKMHAVLCRKWVSRPKGRDWYDLVWYISQNIELDVIHLNARLQQSCKLQNEDGVQLPKNIGKDFILTLLRDRIENLDINSAKEDAVRFIPDAQELDIWTKEFFKMLITQIKFKD